MTLLILKILKELANQKKHLSRDDIRNAKKSNKILVKLVYLLESDLQKK